MQEPSPRQEPEPDGAERRSAGVGFIFVTLLIDILGFGMLIPILPDLIKHLLHGNVTAASQYYGVFLGIYGAMQFLAAPTLGRLSDQWGRRPILLLSLLFTGVDYLIMAAAPNVWWLFLGRTLSGVTGANFTAANAYIADISPPEKRAQNFGLIGAAFGIGFIIGPALGGVLGKFGLRVPFMAAAALALVNWLYGFFILPESLAPENRRRFSWRQASPISSLFLLGRHGLVLALTWVSIFTNLAQQGLQSTWVLYNGYRYGWGPLQNGLSLAVVGLLAGIVQAGLMRRLVPRFGEEKLTLWGLLFNLVSLVLFGLATHGWMIYCILVINACAFVAGPSIQALISRCYGPDEQGAIQGAISSLFSVTGIVGPILGASIFAYFISPAAPVKVPGASFFLGALLSAIGVILAVAAFRRHPAPS